MRGKSLLSWWQHEQSEACLNRFVAIPKGVFCGVRRKPCPGMTTAFGHPFAAWAL